MMMMMKGHFDEKDIKYVFMCKDEHKGLDENTPAVMLWMGRVLKICTYCSQSRFFFLSQWKDTDL